MLSCLRERSPAIFDRKPHNTYNQELMAQSITWLLTRLVAVETVRASLESTTLLSKDFSSSLLRTRITAKARVSNVNLYEPEHNLAGHF